MNKSFRYDAWQLGTWDGLTFQGNLMTLAPGKREGVYLSEVVHVKPFEKMICSWNSHTEVGNTLELLVRVKGRDWSGWMSYGKWTTDGLNKGSIANQGDAVARMVIDEILCKDSCNAYQFRVVFSTESVLTSPALKSVHVSTTDKKELELVEVMNADIEVPQLSQMVIRGIGNRICSPTSMTMVLNYFGEKLEVLDVAKGAFDHGGGIYGNWSYNVAYAGECGMEAKVIYCHKVKTMLDYIRSGIPLIASVKTNKRDQLPGAPEAYPSGHLLVVRGFDAEDNMIIVNDPASSDVTAVRRTYPIDAFAKVWNRILYIIHPSEGDGL